MNTYIFYIFRLFMFKYLLYKLNYGNKKTFTYNW